MAIIGKIRNKSGLLIGFVGVTLVLFILSDYLGNRGNGSQTDNGIYGEVFGEEITAQEYNEEVNKVIEGRKAQGAKDNQAVQDEISESVWQYMVRKKMMAHELDNFGFVISPKELNDLVFGKNISPVLMNPQAQYFKDSTGQYNVNEAIRFRQGLDAKPKNAEEKRMVEENRKKWTELIEIPVKETRVEEKYFNLISKAVYITKAEMDYDYISNARRYKIKYVSARYSDIPDSTIKVSDSEIKDYYEKNKDKRRWEENQPKRTYSYVEFPLIPSAEDVEYARKQLETRMNGFKTANNDSSYVMSYSETKVYNDQFSAAGQFPVEVDSLIQQADSGDVIGPYRMGDFWKITKVRGSKLEDQAKVRHILITYAGAERASATRTKDQAKKLADSLTNVIKKKKNFDELVNKFSEDRNPQTQEVNNGGTYDWFNKEIGFVEPFKNFAFEGKVGEVKVVETIFGFHIMEVLGQRKSKLVRSATVDSKIRALKESDFLVREKAVKFLEAISVGSEFQRIAQKQGLQVKEKEILRSDKFVDQEKTDGGRRMGVWIHNAALNEVSDPRLVGNNYVVATVTGIWEKGAPAYENVKDLMKLEVIKEKKGKILEKKLKGAKSLEDAATRVGKGIQDAELNFSSAIIPGVEGSEYKVIGAIFSMKKEGDLSFPIIGDNGVFVALLTNITEPAPMPEAEAKMQREGMTKSKRQNVRQEVMIAIQDKAKIVDKRPVN